MLVGFIEARLERIDGFAGYHLPLKFVPYFDNSTREEMKGLVVCPALSNDFESLFPDHSVVI